MKQRVEIFISHSSRVDELQNKINAWLDNNSKNIEVITISQSASGSSFQTTTITIFYKYLN